MADWITIDGNQAAAHVAYRLNEVIAIYPITPASPMGEWADEWASQGVPNIFGTVPRIIEMQSEGGAAGCVHGSLQAGALTTTFTASQGLLLMIPNMYKIAGELTPAVFHVASRSLACQALSIFGDHSDVMAARATGFALLCASHVQEAMDFALIAQAASLRSRIPFVHFFDGFRTSHEIQKIRPVTDEQMKAMIRSEDITAFRSRRLSPDNPFIRGTAQNPDVYFQARETVNRSYQACPSIVQACFDEWAVLSGRSYRLFDYYGDPNAQRVIVLMGSGAETVKETVEVLNASKEAVGVVTVRLYRPFDTEAFVRALPQTVKTIAVLDRTKEPGSVGEPLLLDVMAAICEQWPAHHQTPPPRVIGGRYGLSSKEFTPAMVKAVFDEMKKEAPKTRFTVGIVDDVCGTSLEWDERFQTEQGQSVRALFYGLGSDGTVGANKNTIKIIGENTDLFVQGYFVYDSKKSGSRTVSHLRFGPRPIRSSYLIARANFVACHQFMFLERLDVLSALEEGGVFLLNSPYPAGEVWDHLPRKIQEDLIRKKARFYVINAYALAKESGLGRRINTIMQTAFFVVCGLFDQNKALDLIKNAVRKTYEKKGEEIVAMNLAAIDRAAVSVEEVTVPQKVTSRIEQRPAVDPRAPEFVREVLGPMIAGCGDRLPVSRLPEDGTYPSGTAKWEKRNIALEIPVWDPQWCIQCGKCAMVCPHAVIRIKVFDPANTTGMPEGFRFLEAKDKELEGLAYAIQVSPMDCTGCSLCVEVCPAKNKKEPRFKALNMHEQPPILEREQTYWEYFEQLPDIDRRRLKVTSVRQAQILEPLFEFSGACAGCGETPYIKLMTQLFGDRALVANATGCSSIYGGNLPTTPWSYNKEGRGPAWSNSLFEDNAEFGLGFRLAVDKQAQIARQCLTALKDKLGDDFVAAILNADQSDEAGIYEQRMRVEELKKRLRHLNEPAAQTLQEVADYLVKKSVWLIGGDGWAYDIGYGGLDHVLASGEDVNILVLDTEVYSNTGGQSSKATPRAAVAKFAASGKKQPKKDLARMAMSYGYVYVAQVAFGAKDEHTLRAFLEAERYPGPSLIIAYSHCIAHGIDMTQALQDHRAAVLTGYWPLFRYDPQRRQQGLNPFVLDSPPPRVPFKEYAMRENRFRILAKTHPDVFDQLMQQAQNDIVERYREYERLAREGESSSNQGV